MNSLQRLNRKIRHYLPQPRPQIASVAAPCMHCGYDQAVLLHTPVYPDFDLSLLTDRSLRIAFGDRQDGICLRCGIYQAYRRFTPEQLRVINALGKDVTTSEPALQSYPVPETYITNFNQTYFGKRLERWQAYFQAKQIQPHSCLFLRSWFGAAPAFIRQQYGAAVAGLDMSPACLQTTVDRVAGFIPLQGEINGHLAGPFLESGPYDGIFIFHVLTHICQIHQALGQLRQLLRPGGFILLTREIERKPHNPFHMVHLSEIQWQQVLLRHCDRVERIDDCGSTFVPHIHPYTLQGDEPDLVAWFP